MNKPFIRNTALVVLVSFLAELGVPVAVFALTGGPSQPEFSKFEPVSTTSMVNEFDGSFTYNLPVLHVPGPDGGEYAMSLSYHSGISPEEEASWVGYGWTLNPGSITRNKRGFPDDHSGAEITHWNKIKPNWTVTAGLTTQGEFFSYDDVAVSANAGVYLRYNNYRGFGQTIMGGVNVGYRNALNKMTGLGSLNLSYDDEKGHSFTGKISPAAILDGIKTRVGNTTNIACNEETGVVFSKDLLAQGAKMAANVGTAYAFRSGTDNIRPTTLTPYTGSSTNFSYNAEATTFLPIGPEGGVNGSINYQKSEEEIKRNSYGYMYSGQATEDGIMDYSVEKNAPYSRRDHYLSIPYSSADNFIVTGEGIAGGFRLLRNTPGHFKPNKVESSIFILQAGLDLHVGGNVGAGANLGVGVQSLTVGEWSGFQSGYRFGAEKLDVPRDDKMFFRYNNDPGGSITYSLHDGAERADIASDGSSGFRPNINTTNFYSTINNAQKTGRSSYIGYRTIKDMRVNAAPTAEYAIPYRSFTKNKPKTGDIFRPVRTYILDGPTDNSVYENSIGEISTVNDQGYRYTYGLPVYARQEYSVNYGVPTQVDKLNRIIYADLFPPNDAVNSQYNQATSVVGEYKPEPYATNFLLTEITSSDYVDRTHDGPSKDDFGGYVQFHYKRAATPIAANVSDKKGGNTGWYHWRVPYTGFFYNQNEISNPDDDMASMSKGEKEIYYLQGIETKTHIAIFVTNKTSLTIGSKIIQGSQIERLDAFQAPKEADAVKPWTTADVYPLDDNYVERLERIELYAKDADGHLGTLLKTTHFEYDYSLMRGQPNCRMAGAEVFPEKYECLKGYLPSFRAGKLTLKRVWFEYEGVSSAKIAPYVFKYEYKKADDFASTLSQFYAPILNHGNALSDDRNLSAWDLNLETDQNPRYDSYDLDPWGKYRRNGKQRFDQQKTWVDQTAKGNEGGFDPAAWHLKSIQLPSGGEILVQYEQNTYSYVQDKSAMAMVSLDHVTGNRYHLNVEELGITPTDKQKLVRLIRREFIDKANPEKMYFKFLYALPAGATASSPTDRLSEYITGYASISGAGVDIDGNVYVEFHTGDGAPRDICQEFVQKNRGGFDLNLNRFSHDDVLKNTVDIVHQMFTSFLPNAIYCPDISAPYSFVRIPLLAPKKGGGVRVKRLLMYDKGIEDGDAALYGSEYSYETQNDNGETISSGVAANEPSEIREENTLIRYLHSRDDRNFLQKIVSGENRVQFEGPLGEALLPGASIGYSRVVSRNIHKGATTPGFAINEYHTWKDYPIREEHTSIAEEPDFYVLPTGVININIDNLWVTQGYSFTMSNMAGQPKSTKTYAGDYNNPDTWLLSTAQEYEYFEPGERVAMHYGMDKPLQYEYPGKEMEVVFESRSVEDEAIDGSIQVDLSSSITVPFLPIPFVSLMPQLNYNTSKMRTHVTNKIISYPAIVKSMKVFRDGVIHYSEHVAFDPNTGKPLITKTTDGFDALSLKESADHDGTYYSYQVPAAQQYSSMGQKAWNEQTLVTSSPDVGGVQFFKKQTIGGIYYLQASTSDGSTNTDCVYNLYEKFTEGDLVELWKQGVSAGIFHVAGIAGAQIELVPTSYSATHPDGINDKVDIEILASGRTNQLVAGVGSVVSYGRNPNSPTNIPTFLEFPLILRERQKLVDELNKARKSLAVNGMRDIPVPGGMQYVPGPHGSSGSYQPTPSGSIIEIEREPGQFVIRVGSKTMVSYSTKFPGTIHPIVNFLNDALETCWGIDIPTVLEKRETHTTTLGFTDYRYHPALSLGIMQIAMDDIINGHTNNTKKFDWVNGGYSQPFSMSMIPSATTGYQGQYATGIQLGTGPIHLASLQISHGSTPILAAYMQSAKTPGNTDVAQWNVAPPNVVNQTTSIPFSFPNGALSSELGEFVQVGDYIKFNSKKIVIGLIDIPGIKLESLEWVAPQPLCSNIVPLKGEFALDNQGQVVYYKEEGQGSECTAILKCPQFWPTQEEKAKDFGNIVAGSAQTYSDEWGYNPSLYTPISVSGVTFNSFEKAEQGKWRPASAYVYRTDVPDKDGSTPRAIYNRGVFSEFRMFDWQSTEHPKQWVRSSTVTAYSPNGQILAERDVLDMPSAAKFGYNNAVPYLVAKNAEQDAAQFESFENVYSRNSVWSVEDGVILTPTQKDGVLTTYAHSGKKSYKLEATRSSYTTAAFAIPKKMGAAGLSSGISVKVWVKHPASISSVPVEGTVDPTGSSTFPSVPMTFAKVARTGEWTLYEAAVAPASLHSIVGKQATVSIAKVAGINELYIDDVRLQPLDAEMTCYVYDVATLRLLSVFDDQHFGLFYQYNAEGKLVRKIAETERGIKTIVETQYHTPLADYRFKCPLPDNGSSSVNIPETQPLLHNSIDADTLGTSSGANGSFDLLDVRLTPDKQSMKMLGRDDITLPDSIRTSVPKVRVPAADSLSKRVLPNVDAKRKMDAVQTPIRKQQDTLNTGKPVQQQKR